MTTTVAEPVTEVKERTRHGARGFLRGSSLLLVGRLVSIGINFLVQVLTVRYLAKADYGAFQWAVAISAMGASAILLGLNRGVARFAPIHHEHKRYGEMFGAMAFSLATVVGLGLAVVVTVLGARGLILEHVESELSVGLLLILIGLVPLDALDALFETLLAVFGGARPILVRRYVLAPCIKLAAVGLVLAVGGSVQLLAAAYLVEGLIGIVVYSLVLWRMLERLGLLHELHPRRLVMPDGSFFRFSLPLLTTDLLLAIEIPVVVIVLERFHGTVGVADLRATEALAGICLVVFQAFKILFRSQAARLYARDDERGLGELYWRGATWITIVSFPVFALCVFLAEPLTVFLCGERYAGAGVLLAILAAGKYFNAAMGMNTFTLQVYARVRLILVINTVSAVLGLGLCLGLVPRFGAVGGALATSIAIVIRNALYQAALIATSREVGLVPRPALRVYGSVVAAVATLALVRQVSDNVVVLAAAVVVASGLMAWVNRGFLDIAETFPELAKVPLVGKWLGARAG